MPFPPREATRYTPFVIIGGGLIGLATGGFQWHLQRALHGSLIALTCFGMALAAEIVLHGCRDVDAILEGVQQATGGARDDDQTLLMLQRS